MGYPVSYRHGAQRYGDGSFQEPAPNRRPYQDPMHPPYQDPPKPANDPWPAPANDNEPRGRYSHPRFPKLPPWPGPPARGRSRGGFRRPPGLPWQLDLAINVGLIAFNYYAGVHNKPVITTTPGWQVVCGPKWPNELLYPGAYGYNILGGNVCGLAMQAFPATPYWPTTNTTTVGLAKSDGKPVALRRWQCVMSWKKIANGYPIPVSVPLIGPITPVEVPAEYPATVANPVPAFVPQVVGYEVPQSRPIPASVPRNPGAYAPPVRARNPAGRLDPDAPGVVIVPDSPLPPRQPPGKGTKERKVTEKVPGFLANALGKAAGVYESAKFANDIVNAFYDALPGKKSAKTPQDKLAELYRRYDEVDVNKAIEGVLKAVAYERAGAYIDRARRTASKNLGLHMHIQIPTGGGPRV